MKKKYVAEIDWGDGGECRLSAASLEEAWDLACQWARDGDWEDCSRVSETEDRATRVRNDVWAHVSVSGDDDEWMEEDVLVWDTDEHDPPCPGGGHEWESTVEIDGGCDQNPGWMSGPGRAWSSRAHCAVCGMRRTEYGDPDAAEQWRRTIVQWREWDMSMRLEDHDLHGTGAVPCEVYPMPGDGWDAVTSVPCPVEGRLIRDRDQEEEEG
ncbi:MAG: hypothetical protein ACE5F1_16275 [Planctomycetota bacterium]